MVLGLYLSLAIVLPLAVGATVRLRSLPRTRQCPGCGRETLRLRSRLHAAVSFLSRRHDLHHRWCPACTWKGTVRLANSASVPFGDSPDASVMAPPAGVGESVEVRHVDVAGHRWRVMVQCWQTRNGWVGRLLFVGPDGHAWMEADWSIKGRSVPEVLAHALTIPEHSLSGRLRRALQH